MILLRPATPADAGAIAEVYLAARAAALPTVRWAHDAEDVRGWIAGHLVPSGTLTVAVERQTLHGYLGQDADWVDHLYLHPLSWRRGIGSRLLAHAMRQSPSGLRLWCFQVNARARAFYERHGFVADRLTDGADNEEREPDVLYVWPGSGTGAEP